MVATADDGFVLTGYTRYSSRGKSEVWLIRTEGDGPPPCDLEVALSNYAGSVERGGTLSFTVTASNACDDALSMDRVVLDITGPASLQKVLYDGSPVSVVGDIVRDLSLACPPGAPLGTYAVEVTIYRDGEAIDADAFEVDVTNCPPPSIECKSGRWATCPGGRLVFWGVGRRLGGPFLAKNTGTHIHCRRAPRRSHRDPLQSSTNDSRNDSSSRSNDL